MFKVITDENFLEVGRNTGHLESDTKLGQYK